ncbi:MAG TPA: hypothetical protein VGZ73_14145 [Bryobacteraceae bacterium]|nr:hypothetical protein [Bryobacteraceae bacterium]
MSLHDRLLDTLQSVASVSLVSSLRDERLNLPGASELHVFIPDLHLITAQRRTSAHFLYGTNWLQGPDLLGNTVRALKGFKAGAAPGENVTVYQIGDLLDLWREVDGLNPNADVASAIEDDHGALMEAFYDNDLNVQFLLGNHDYDLYRFANYAAWGRSYHLSPSVLLLHGDIFDWVEALPAALKNFFVYLFSPGVKPTSNELERMRPYNLQMRGGRQFPNYIQNAAPAPVGTPGHADQVASAAGGAGTRYRFNVQVEGSSPANMLTFLDAAQRKCADANAQFANAAFKVVVIGHTHHARIALRENGDDLFALIDCGAWIENCISEDSPNPQPNAQIAALGVNEARIYQLAPLP